MSAFNPDTLAESELRALRDRHQEVLAEVWSISSKLRAALRIWSSSDMRNQVISVANQLEDLVIDHKPNRRAERLATPPAEGRVAADNEDSENKQLKLF